MEIDRDLTNGVRLIIDDAVLSTMCSHAQMRCLDKEAGGVLIGQLSSVENSLVIDRITQPLPGDVRSRFGFFRRQRKHQSVLDKEWEDSGHRRTYFGEWHTHPESRPTPSPMDLKSWREKLLNTSMVVPHLIFIIVGQVDTGVWAGERGHPDIWELAMIRTGGLDGRKGC